jgi:beta-mannanase
MFYSPEYCGGYCNFDPKLFDRVRDHGSIPFVTWASLPATGAFTNAKIAAGAQDAYLRRWATAAKNWGHPFFLRFDWEMNGSWFGWGVGANGNRAIDYVRMWRHVHRVFQSVGATNVTWVWCPNVDLDRLAPLASLYPGDAYVDWVGLDGYNWGTNPAGHNGGWETFDQVYRSTYDTIVNWIAPGKPMIVSEVGSTEYGGSKAAWITDMLRVQLVRNYPKIHGVLWFDRRGAEADNMDWPIESSAAARRAFARGIRNRIYVANSYAALGGSKVRRP